MQLICHREGRAGYHIGDIVHVPDDVTVFDHTYFRLVPNSDAASIKACELAEAEAAQQLAAKQAKEKAELAEIAKLEAQLAQADKAKSNGSN